MTWTRLLIVTAAVAALTAPASAQSRLVFRQSPAQTAATQHRLRPAAEHAIAEPSGFNRLTIVPPATPSGQEPHKLPAAPAVRLGLVLRGDDGIEVEAQVNHALHRAARYEPEPLKHPSLGARRINPPEPVASTPRGMQRTSFEVVHSYVEEELEAPAPPDLTPAQEFIVHQEPVPGHVEAFYAAYLPAYAAGPHFSAHFPYARKHCRNYPFDPWTGYCFERMCRYGLIECGEPSCSPMMHWRRGGLAGCGCGGCPCHTGCSHGWSPGSDHAAVVPPPASGAASSGFEKLPLPSQPRHPVRVYPRPPRNVPPPKHLYQSGEW